MMIVIVVVIIVIILILTDEIGAPNPNQSPR